MLVKYRRKLVSSARNLARATVATTRQSLRTLVPAPRPYEVRRLLDQPIISIDIDPSLDSNVNGPSLIKVPEWITNPLARYYLYFAHHKGHYIRLAYSDDLAGPWTIYQPGVLPLPTSHCHDHVASPDVHVDHEARQIRMYFHGPAISKEEAKVDPLRRILPSLGTQRTKIALSHDALTFRALDRIQGPEYFRVFRYAGWWYALSMPGLILRSPDGVSGWEAGAILFEDTMRHSAVRVRGDTLEVYYSRIGDAPERIFLATINLLRDWRNWQPSRPIEILRPERPWEGADKKPEPSRRGGSAGPVCQLRDPCIYEEQGRTYLLYSIAGEQGIGIAELINGTLK